MNYLIAWIVLCVVLLIIEGLSVNLITVWFALGAGAAFFMALFHMSFIWQLGVFVGVSIVALLLTRPLVVKLRKRKPGEKTNFEAYIGKEAIVIEEINNVRGNGLIRIGGVNWTAVSEDGSDIPVDTRVEVVAVKGVRAFVKIKE